MTTQGQTIPVGYKLTEVGVIPADWEVIKLGDIVKFFKGNGLSKNEIKDNGKNRCIHYGELFTRYKEKIKIVYSLTNKDKSKSFLSLKNDILMPTSDVTPRGLATASCIKESGIILGGDILVIRDQTKFLDGDYFSYHISQNKQSVLKLVKGSTVYHLHGSDMGSFLFSVPPTLAEQTRIATVLSDIDELITQMDELIAKKKAIKQGAMQSLLTPKKDWEVKKLGEMVDFMKGSGLSKTKIVEGGRNSCILYGELFTTYSYVIKDVVSNTNSTEGLPSKYGDILLPGSTTTVGIDLANASALLNDNILLGGDINILRKKYQVNSEFLAYYLTESKKYEIAEQTQGITIIHLYGRSLKNLDIYLPKISEQNQIVTILSDMDQEIQELEQKKSKYEQIKQGAMQQLLTGKIRLK